MKLYSRVVGWRPPSGSQCAPVTSIKALLWLHSYCVTSAHLPGAEQPSLQD